MVFGRLFRAGLSPGWPNRPRTASRDIWLATHKEQPKSGEKTADQIRVALDDPDRQVLGALSARLRPHPQL